MPSLRVSASLASLGLNQTYLGTLPKHLIISLLFTHSHNTPITGQDFFWTPIDHPFVSHTCSDASSNTTPDVFAKPCQEKAIDAALAAENLWSSSSCWSF